jgi:PAS domain S-box-containing protein
MSLDIGIALALSGFVAGLAAGYVWAQRDLRQLRQWIADAGHLDEDPPFDSAGPRNNARDIVAAFRRFSTALAACRERARQRDHELAHSVETRTAELTSANTALRAEIDERRRAEEKFRTLLESAGDAILLVDDRGSITLANTLAARWFGYEHGELVGLPVESLIPESQRDAHREHRRRYTAQPHTRPMGTGLELRGRRRDGTEFPVEISLSPLSTADGAQVTVIVRDITERSIATRRIRDLNEHLTRRSQELEAVNGELEAFSYTVSHDLRAPLRSIDGFSRALLEDCLDRLDGQGQDYLQRVRAAAQRMAELIDDVLALSRVTRSEMRVQPVDLSALAADVLAELRQSHPERQVQTTVTPGLSATGDPRLLRILLANLLSNAWKFTARTAQARIEFGADPWTGAPQRFFVRDNGAGFDMAYADKLFVAFQRLHTPAEFPGSGIGLATVQRILHRHGGRAWATGAPGAGATFSFTLDSAAGTRPGDSHDRSNDTAG